MENETVNDAARNELFEKATTPSAMAAFVQSADAVVFLAENAKKPPARKAVLLLATKEDSESEEGHAKRVSGLSVLWAIKSLRSIVDEYSPRVLAVPFPVVSPYLSLKERKSVVAWISGKSIPWLFDFSAKSVFLELDDVELSSEFIKILVRRSASLCSVIQTLLENYEPQLSEATCLRNVNLVAAFCTVAGKSNVVLGRNFGEMLRTLLNRVAGEVATNAPDDKTRLLGLSVIALVEGCAKNNIALLLDDSIFAVLRQVERDWISPRDKQWLKFKANLLSLVENLLITVVMQGSVNPGLLEKIRFLDPSKGAVQKLAKNISNQWDIASPASATWLEQVVIGQEVLEAAAPVSRSDLETLAAVLIHANQIAGLMATIMESELLSRMESLLTEIGQLGKRNGLSLDHPRNTIVPFDSARQRLTTGNFADRVRVVCPGVTKESERGKLVQIIPAVVDPAP